MHCAHLQMGGQKMAKRTGNFARPADLYERGTSPRALRYALLAAHYRAGLELSDDSLAGAAAAVTRLSTALAALDAYNEDRADDATLQPVLAAARAAFEEALDDDLNASPALAALFDVVRELNRRVAERTLSTADARRGAELIRDLDSVLAVAEEDPDELSVRRSDCSTSALRPELRETGRDLIRCVQTWRSSTSSSRTPLTASAGAAQAR